MAKGMKMSKLVATPNNVGSLGKKGGTQMNAKVGKAGKK